MNRKVWSTEEKTTIVSLVAVSSLTSAVWTTSSTGGVVE